MELLEKWSNQEKKLRNASPNFGELFKDGKRAPRAGELFYNRGLARILKLLAKKGKRGFYHGPVAEALIEVIKDRGGCLSLEDLKDHARVGSQNTDAISLPFKGQGVGRLHEGPPEDGMDDETAEGVELWEHPPNGQGLVALIALGILEELEKMGAIKKFSRQEHNTVDYLHAIIESLRIAFGDGVWWVADPDKTKLPLKTLLSRTYFKKRAELFDPHHASPMPKHGSPAFQSSDTVYFSVTDAHGNGASFINSVYSGFGSGIIPRDCGFTLQNRGGGFLLGPDDHPNVYAPGKRPYHTIIPALITNPKDGSLHSVFGVMGGYMQPQGHVQVLLNMLAFRMTPQAALDAPRFCIGAGTPEEGKVLSWTVHLEEGIGTDVVKGLELLGHEVKIITGKERGLFGRGQIIRCHEEDGRIVYSAGSDPRGDGAAFPVGGRRPLSSPRWRQMAVLGLVGGLAAAMMYLCPGIW